MRNTKMHSLCHFLLKLFIIHVFSFNQNVVNAVVVNDIKLLSSSGKPDYVLSGESFTLTCLYMLELKESVSYVEWDLNTRVIYVHKTDLDKPAASGIFSDRVDYTSKSMNSISVRNATKEMAGRYSCHVFTNLTSTAVTTSRQIHIIQDFCSQEEWKTHSDMVNCKEQISLNCRNLFPKPITACALYNDYTSSIIKVETRNRFTPNKDHTFDLNVFATYDVEEIKSLDVPVSFRCKLTVEGTSWRKSFVHSLFAESVCLLRNENQSIKNFIKKPNNIYLFNESQVEILNKEAGCLVGYREGSIIKASCAKNSPLLVCVNASWTAIDQSDSFSLNTKIIKKEKIDWTKLNLNRNIDVKCSSCSHYLSITLLFAVCLLNFISLLSHVNRTPVT